MLESAGLRFNLNLLLRSCIPVYTIYRKTLNKICSDMDGVLQMKRS
jgi:hypothetical protein